MARVLSLLVAAAVSLQLASAFDEIGFAQVCSRQPAYVSPIEKESFGGAGRRRGRGRGADSY
jgi:hypothetical protein